MVNEVPEFKKLIETNPEVVQELKNDPIATKLWKKHIDQVMWFKQSKGAWESRGRVQHKNFLDWLKSVGNYPHTPPKRQTLTPPKRQTPPKRERPPKRETPPKRQTSPKRKHLKKDKHFLKDKTPPKKQTTVAKSSLFNRLTKKIYQTLAILKIKYFAFG